jgi:hypothetical protein
LESAGTLDAIRVDQRVEIVSSFGLYVEKMVIFDAKLTIQVDKICPLPNRLAP